jgi:hypothetical protein
MIDPFTCQGTQMTTSYLFNTRAKTGLGNQILIAKDWAQLIAGTTKDILEHPEKTFLMNKDNMVYNIQGKFLRETGCSIKQEPPGYTTKLQRTLNYEGQMITQLWTVVPSHLEKQHS